jgi:hypothetical protein
LQDVMFRSNMKSFLNARPTGVRVRQFNATTTTGIRQPRSLSARQELTSCSSSPFSMDFDYTSLFSPSYDFGPRCFVKPLPGCASPSSPLFDAITQAINALNCTKIQDFKLTTAPDVIDAGRGEEQGPPLDPQADQELSADVRRANKAAIASAGMWSPDELLTAVQTAAYPTTHCRKINSGQVRIVTDLPGNDSTALRWAAHEPHTPALMGVLPAAAAALQRVTAAEPQPAASVAPPAWAAKSSCKSGGGRGRGSAGDRVGGRNPPAVEQVPGPGADAAPGRAQ